LTADYWSGQFTVAPEGFDFPPVPVQIGPQQATMDLIPVSSIDFDYDPSSGTLDTSNGARFTLLAEMGSGGTCETELGVSLSTENPGVFPGEPFDAESLPPTNGTIADDFILHGDAEGVECVVFNDFAEGDGGIRLSNVSTQPEGGTITAKPKKKQKQIAFGSKVTIQGQLSDVPSGSGFHTIELIEDRFPYGRPAPVAVTTAEEDGSFAFRVRPEMNTKYTVRDLSGSGATSDPFPVWVWEKTAKYDVDVIGDYRVRANFSLKFSRELKTDFTKRKMFWYFTKVGTRKFTLMDRTKIKQRPGRISSRATFGVPRKGRYRFYVNPCYDEPRGDDGAGKPKRFRCPRKKHSRPGDFQY
jgi:hypothetical protein